MIIIILIMILAITLYLYGSRTFKYWEVRGIKHDKPIPIFGNNIRGYFFQASVTQIAVEQYWKYPNEKVVGFFRSTRPELTIRDPEIIKRILITDFASFHHRGIVSRQTIFEPLMQNLIFADGDPWKLLRQRLTPTFTAVKIKAMFPLVVERAERLQVRISDLVTERKCLDARELMARYTTDFIGAVALGLDTNALNDDNSSFRQLGVKIFNVRAQDIAKSLLKDVFPRAFENLKIITRLDKELNELLGEIMRHRNYMPSERNDFIDLMLECKMKGTIVGKSIERTKPDGTPETATLEFNDGVIAAQVFIFFAAGFETSSSSASFVLHQLAYHQTVQKKAQAEIDRVLAKHGGKLSYDAIKEMTYLEWVFKEGLRMFPATGFLIRQCVKPYTFQDLDVSIDEGVRIIIPIQAIQMDPKYFPQPEEFRPKRFDPQTFNPRSRFLYLPFGEGPRACIGARLALMQSLSGLVAVLARFSVQPGPETIRHPKLNTRSSIVQSFIGGLPLVFQQRC